METILSEGLQTADDVQSALDLPASDIESLTGLPTGYLTSYSRVGRSPTTEKAPSQSIQRRSQPQCCNYRCGLVDHLAAAAFLAIADRSSGVSFAARLAALLTAQPAQLDRSRVLPLVRVRRVVLNLACGDLDDAVGKLVGVARALRPIRGHGLRLPERSSIDGRASPLELAVDAHHHSQNDAHANRHQKCFGPADVLREHLTPPAADHASQHWSPERSPRCAFRPIHVVTLSRPHSA